MLDASLGGAALGSTRTSLPLGLGADLAHRDALLIANAGQTNLDPGGGGADATITSQPTTRSIFLDARHDFGGGFVAFANLLDTRNTGRTVGSAQEQNYTTLPAADPLNPFQQEIAIAIPASALTTTTVNRIESTRYTLGLIAPLPAGWRANIEYNGGTGRSRFRSVMVVQGSGPYDPVTGKFGGGLPILDPLGDWASYLAALSAYLFDDKQLGPRKNHFDDATLRIAGPVATLPGGPLTLTLLGEARREVTARSAIYYGEPPYQNPSIYPRLEARVFSLYGEMRVPLVGDHGRLSGLELQLAVRQDWTRTILPGSKLLFGADLPPFVARSGTPAYTLGARFSPLPGLLVRSSVGTGSLPPTANQIGRVTDIGVDYRGDPRRGGRTIGSEGAVKFLNAGNPDLVPERARSYLIGVVVTPAGDHGARLSIDYTRINKRNEIQSFPYFDVDTLILEEVKYPRRVIRGPLTAADKALGFSGGPIQTLDFSLLNLGRTRIDAIDVTLD